MRFALAEDTTPGQDIKLWEDKFKSGKAIRIKLWNAAHYILNHQDRMKDKMKDSSILINQHSDDIEIAVRLKNTKAKLTEHLENYQYREAASILRHFLYDDLCGWYIEQTKARLYDNDDLAALQTLMHCLDATLIMFHPFMPYVTERIRSTYSDVKLITDKW